MSISGISGATPPTGPNKAGSAQNASQAGVTSNKLLEALNRYTDDPSESNLNALYKVIDTLKATPGVNSQQQAALQALAEEAPQLMSVPPNTMQSAQIVNSLVGYAENFNQQGASATGASE